MQIFAMAYIHDRLLQVNEIIFCKVVFVPGTGIAGSLHKILPFHIIFPQTVDDNMHMNVAASIMPIHMCTDESLVSGEVLLSIFYTKLLRPFPGQSPVYGILWIKADDVVVGFNLTVVQVLFPFIIQFLTLDVKSGGMAVNPVQIIFLTQYFIPCII